jgi:hypothetical protein
MALSEFLSSSIVFYIIAAFALFLLQHFTYATDTPYIKNLAQIHGWPVFGSLIELGETHAKVFGVWSKRYGPVFQVRLGNKVRLYPWRTTAALTLPVASCCCQYIRKCEKALDQQSVCAGLSAHVPYFSLGCLKLPGFYHWYLTLG